MKGRGGVKLAIKGTCEICNSGVFKTLSREIRVGYQIPFIPHRLIDCSKEINREFAKYLVKHPRELYNLSADYFEKIVAEILTSCGYKVQLHVRLRGAGKGDEADIIAIRQFPGIDKPLGMIVECKKYAENRKVDLQIATRLFGLKERFAQTWGLDRALIATTSHVTREVHEEYGRRWDFEIKEYEKIIEWLEEYSELGEIIYLRSEKNILAKNEIFIASLNKKNRYN
jgi:hypothetical protein